MCLMTCQQLLCDACEHGVIADRNFANFGCYIDLESGIFEGSEWDGGF